MKITPADPVLNLASLSAPSVFTFHPGHCPVSTSPALRELFPLLKLPFLRLHLAEFLSPLKTQLMYSH